MVRPPCSNFRLITADFSGVLMFMSFMVFQRGKQDPGVAYRSISCYETLARPKIFKN